MLGSLRSTRPSIFLYDNSINYSEVAPKNPSKKANPKQVTKEIYWVASLYPTIIIPL